MAERRATNKYYPPDYDPSKHGSINSYVGQHPLRDRARKLNQGILVVRFEMPYNVWCMGCNNHIGRGVRYNAEKKQVGKYLSSKILSFGMKCHLCDQRFTIETDPEHGEFKLVSGLKRRVEEWDNNDQDNYTNKSRKVSSSKEKGGDEEEEEQDNTLISNNQFGRIKNQSEKDRLENDPLFKLESIKKDKERGIQIANTIETMYQVMEKRNNNYEMSSILRKSFREQKNQRLKEIKENESRGITIELLPISKEDREEASKTNFMASLKRKANQESQLKYDDIMTTHLYDHNSNNNNNNTTITTTTTNNNVNINSNNHKTPTVNINKTNDNNLKRKEILKKKSRLDPSLFSRTNNSTKPTINSTFSSSLFK